MFIEGGVGGGIGKENKVNIYLNQRQNEWGEGVGREGRGGTKWAGMKGEVEVNLGIGLTYER